MAEDLGNYHLEKALDTTIFYTLTSADISHEADNRKRSPIRTRVSHAFIVANGLHPQSTYKVTKKKQ